MKYSVLLVGGGKIAGLLDFPGSPGLIRTHARALEQSSHFKIAGLVEPDVERATLFQKKWSVERVYSGLEEISHEQLYDVVIIASPNASHFSQAELILQKFSKPKVLVIEKPVCDTLDQMQRLSILAAQKNVPVLINHSRRFSSAFQNVATQIRSGLFGDLISAQAHYYGGWRNNGTHMVDLLRMLLGDLGLIKSAFLRREIRKTDPDIDAVFKIGNALMTVQSFDENCYQLFECDLKFTLGRVEIRNFGIEILAQQVLTNDWNERELHLMPQFSSNQALQDVFSGLVSTVLQFVRGTPPLTTPGISSDIAQAFETLKVIQQVAVLAKPRYEIL